MKKNRMVIMAILACMLASAQNHYSAERRKMVQVQLEARDIKDAATLRAMLHVPRHKFVPQNIKKYAYTDGALPIGDDQTISQPYIVAYMTQALELTSDDHVLEIGTGSGYQAAVLAEIVDSVYTIEIVKNLALKARERLQALGYTNIEVRAGDGYNGWPSEAPFDAIMVTAGATDIPEPLLAQLKEGGRMIIPVGPHNGIRRLVLVKKKKDKILAKKLIAVRFVPFTRNNKKDH